MRCLSSRPGVVLSQGDGVVSVVGRGTEDDVAVLCVLFQHLLCLLTRHGEETAGGRRRKEAERRRGENNTF